MLLQLLLHLLLDECDIDVRNDIIIILGPFFQLLFSILTIILNITQCCITSFSENDDMSLKIKNNVFWVGKTDWEIRKFHGNE